MSVPASAPGRSPGPRLRTRTIDNKTVLMGLSIGHGKLATIARDGLHRLSRVFSSDNDPAVRTWRLSTLVLAIAPDARQPRAGPRGRFADAVDRSGSHLRSPPRRAAHRGALEQDGREPLNGARISSPRRRLWATARSEVCWYTYRPKLALPNQTRGVTTLFREWGAGDLGARDRLLGSIASCARRRRRHD